VSVWHPSCTKKNHVLTEKRENRVFGPMILKAVRFEKRSKAAFQN
jgi:hypothetical protein